ncbi:MAG: tetratricopeptide repeat protein [Tannerellaceae bacterium]|jgi:tetratricopeptide (TPR) repeat protein|nr:tetratricopeptide repeat protein [Tannerellaceae bacterium]
MIVKRRKAKEKISDLSSPIVKQCAVESFNSGPILYNSGPIFIKNSLDIDITEESALSQEKEASSEEQVKEIKKGDAHICILIARLYELIGKLKDAKDNYRQAVEIFPSFENYLQLANFYSRQNDLSKAESHYLTCLFLAKTLPERAEINNHLGNLYRKKKDYPRAAASFEEALMIQRELADINPQVYLPEVVQTLALLAVFYQQEMPDEEHSVRYAKDLLSLSPEDTPAVRQARESAENVLKSWKNRESQQN